MTDSNSELDESDQPASRRGRFTFWEQRPIDVEMADSLGMFIPQPGRSELVVSFCKKSYRASFGRVQNECSHGVHVGVTVSLRMYASSRSWT